MFRRTYLPVCRAVLLVILLNSMSFDSLNWSFSLQLEMPPGIISLSCECAKLYEILSFSPSLLIRSTIFLPSDDEDEFESNDSTPFASTTILLSVMSLCLHSFVIVA